MKTFLDCLQHCGAKQSMVLASFKYPICGNCGSEICFSSYKTTLDGLSKEKKLELAKLHIACYEEFGDIMNVMEALFLVPWNYKNKWTVIGVSPEKGKKYDRDIIFNDL